MTPSSLVSVILSKTSFSIESLLENWKFFVKLKFIKLDLFLMRSILFSFVHCAILFKFSWVFRLSGWMQPPLATMSDATFDLKLYEEIPKLKMLIFFKDT